MLSLLSQPSEPYTSRVPASRLNRDALGRVVSVTKVHTFEGKKGTLKPSKVSQIELKSGSLASECKATKQSTAQLGGDESGEVHYEQTVYKGYP
jgi:hypothetical protein